MNHFNKHFSASSGFSRDSGIISASTGRDYKASASAYLPPLDILSLRSLLFSIKRHKTPGIDEIRVGGLVRNFDVIKVLLTMINGFLLSGTIPAQLKTALVKPLFKGGTPDRYECYRPISILLALLKCWKNISSL